MIVFKNNKGFQTRSDISNENWTDKDCYVVEDGSDLANKIISAYPYYSFITDIDGNLVDIKILEKPTSFVTWEEIRKQRNNFLRETDWTQLTDCQLTEEEKEKYHIYRQTLRDIPQTYEEPGNVVWPEKP